MIRIGHKRLLLCLLALMVGVLRTSGAHAHLCEDGREPPAVVHLADAGSHPCEASSSSHHSGDRDVRVADDILVKKSALADPLLPVAQFDTLKFIPAQAGAGVAPVARSLRVESIVFLRPPLRGPPA